MELAYYCENCRKDVEADPCPACRLPARRKRDQEESQSRSREESSALKLVAKPNPSPQSAASSPQQKVTEESSTRDETAQLQDYLKKGYEVFLIAGITGAGKTELLGAYKQNAYLDELVREQGRALPTPVESLNCYAIEVGRRKVIFMDASGERFRQLYPEAGGVGLREAQIEFLRTVSSQLRGLILLVDLGRLWGSERAQDPANARQVQIVSWVLQLLRWLRFGSKYEPGPVSFQAHVNRELKTMRRRLKIPVQVLFSKADCLNGLLAPQQSGHQSRPGETAVHRTLFPAGEDPILLSYHCLPELLETLVTHARHFRFDFVHSLVTDRVTGAVTDSSSRGVTLSLQWLLGWSWRWPMIPSRYWLWLQHFLDAVVMRNDRWKRLPNPGRVGR